MMIPFVTLWGEGGAIDSVDIANVATGVLELPAAYRALGIEGCRVVNTTLNETNYVRGSYQDWRLRVTAALAQESTYDAHTHIAGAYMAGATPVTGASGPVDN